MKKHIPARAEDLMIIGRSNSPHSIEPEKTKSESGSNNWLKIIIVGGIVIISGVVAYHVTKPKNKNHEEE